MCAFDGGLFSSYNNIYLQIVEERVGDSTTTMPVSISNNISELDTLLADLSNARYACQDTKSVNSTNYAYGDYSDLESYGGDKPPERFEIQ